MGCPRVILGRMWVYIYVLYFIFYLSCHTSRSNEVWGLKNTVMDRCSCTYCCQLVQSSHYCACEKALLPEVESACDRHSIDKAWCRTILWHFNEKPRCIPLAHPWILLPAASDNVSVLVWGRKTLLLSFLPFLSLSCEGVGLRGGHTTRGGPLRWFRMHTTANILGYHCTNVCTWWY